MEDNKFLNTPIKYATKICVSPTSIHKLNPEFSLCSIDVMYVDENRNGTDIPKSTVEDAIYSLYGVPIVGEWLEDEGRFGGHGEKIEFKDGELTYTVCTKPIGFVTKEAVENATWIEKPLPNGHEMKTWLHLDKCILWTGRYEEAQSIIDEGCFQSMEVKFLDGEYSDNGYFRASKMIFSALCAIGVEPCFEEANIRRQDYSFDSFKQEYSQLLDEYKKFNDEQEIINNKKEEKLMKFKEINNILSTVKCEKSGEEVCKYRLLNVTEDKVFALDIEDYKAYGFNYALVTEGEAENLVVDFESKVEMSLSATDKITDENFEEFSINDEINAVVSAKFEKELDVKVKEYTETLANEFNTKYEELKENYEALSQSYQVASKQLDAYNAKEKAEADEAHKNEIENLFTEFEPKLSKSSEYLIYRAKTNAMEVTAEEVREKLTLMVGKYMLDNQTKKNFSYQPNVAGVTNNEKVENPYGHLLDKYIR